MTVLPVDRAILETITGIPFSFLLTKLGWLDRHEIQMRLSALVDGGLVRREPDGHRPDIFYLTGKGKEALTAGGR